MKNSMNMKEKGALALQIKDKWIQGISTTTAKTSRNGGFLHF
jgi:hypothetical protein